ncbi:hypothetical protein TCAP_02624 [Tolypocladium capitatum]|uniref:Uncharacterized protein n=1 Tax=Tolypocladium capitatum TaxID=45235 RepID=A0A2K3QIW5_9HYPO|nr:hypothetical protein TCAP_02624 [Tolypocladium capitatum]
MLQVHGVNLLKRAALALDDEKVHQPRRRKVAAREDVPVLEVDRLGDEGREEGDEKVPDPVARRSQRHALGAVPRWEQLRLDGPDHGAPGRREAEDEERREDDEYDARRRRRLRVRHVELEVADGREDDQTDEHPRRARHERLAPPVVLDQVQAYEGDKEVDGVEDDLRDEAVDLHRAEDGRPVVEEVRDPERDPIRHPRRPPHAHKLGDGALLDLVLGPQLALDLLNLRVHGPVPLRRAVHAAQRLPGRLGAPPAAVEARRLGEQQDAEAQHHGPHPAEPDDEAPARRAVGPVRHGAVVEARGEEDAHGDEELVRAHHGAADPRRRRLGLVHGHDQGQAADAEARDEPPDHDLVPGVRGGDLHDEAEGCGGAPQRDAGAPADAVRDGGAGQGADERADGEQRDDEA